MTSGLRTARMDPELEPFVPSFPPADLNDPIAARKKLAELSARASVPDVEGMQIEDRTIPGNPAVPVRIYRPPQAQGAIVWLHGGGFVMGGLDVEHPWAVRIADDSGAIVVSVGYNWLLGPFGLALLGAAPRWREHGSAIEQHWSARDDDVWSLDPQASPGFGRGARRFDGGGVLDPLRLAMFEAAQQQLRHWGARVTPQLRARTDALDAALRDAGLGSWCTAGHAAHFTGLRPPAPDFAAVVAALRAANIACTARHGVLRIAPHLHVSLEDIARAVGVMSMAAGQSSART